MSSATVPIVSALLVQLALGLAVFQANARRLSNQCFLLLSIGAALWLTSLYVAASPDSAAIAANAIRQGSACGVMILACLNLLRLSITHREEGWPGIFWRSRFWLIGAVGMMAFCQTHAFLATAALPHSDTSNGGFNAPVYGPWAFLYVIYFAGAVLALTARYIHDLRKTTGGQHAELSFILIGEVLALFTVLLAFGVGFVVERERVVWFAPFRILIFSLVIAYGIATRKIMEVGFFLRRSMSYLVLSVYLLALYGVIWWLVAVGLAPVVGSLSRLTGHVVAALVIAFAMAPARGISQSLADRLFVGTRGLDFQSTMSKAAVILRSVSTLNELLESFAKTTSEAVGTDRIFILLPAKAGYGQHYPPNPKGSNLGGLFLRQDEALIEHLQTNPEPIVVDELHRIRLTPQLRHVAKQMKSLQVAVVMGIFSREHLAGVMLLGPRLSGRIYGSVEQNALQVLCGQLAVAIDNAHLFTEVQNAKIYNEILLQHLTTGVIAASADGVITVFNHEAEQITDLPAKELLDKPVYTLPLPLREVLEETLRYSERLENRELILQSARGSVVARASSSIFHGQDGQMMGGLMVLTDITALKRLELQIRRSDRLASLGTLSAGMAHEIKNPLVSIKTFAQLLPERYQDSDFRETFSNLIGHEIDRIDSLVNQLLRFARPAKPLLKPLHVHEVLEKSLMLVGHRLYQKEIKLSRSWNADVDTIRADADQIEQVFLNFFLNAMDAMKHGGELQVTTEICSADEWASPVDGLDHEMNEVLRITVRDNGEGIKSEDIPHVFDPFFTTKDYGTGLGLSVVHGIIQEHGGQIEVDSELSKGTAFHILLPLVRFEQEVVAA